MSDALPLPLVPPDVDLRDFGFMPLDVRTLLTSSLWIKAKRDPRVAHAAMSLWCECWHQLPASSLPDDDEVLADLARCDAKEWARIRERALHNFVKCSDGRLYHKHVAKKANESWEAKLAQRNRTSKATEAREAKRREREEADRRARESVRDEQRDVVRDVPRDVPRDESRDVHQGTGTGTGTGTVNTTPTEAARIEPNPPSEPDPAQPRRGAMAMLLRSLGVTCTYSHPTVVGWAQQGVTDEQITEAVQTARMHKPAPAPIPIAYLAPIVTEIRSPSAGAPHAASPRPSRPLTATERNIAVIAKLTGRDRDPDRQTLEGSAERLD